MVEILRVTLFQNCLNCKSSEGSTSPYHPQTNRQYEWFNSKLINMPGTLPPNIKSSWRDLVPMLVHVYNCTRSTAIGFSPYYLMYGQKPNSKLICILVLKRQIWMLPQVLNLCNTYVKGWNGLTKQPNRSLKRKTKDMSETMIIE